MADARVLNTGMTADPFEIAATALTRAASEFEGVRRQCDQLRLDNHQLKRRLERAEERYQDLEAKYVDARAATRGL